MLCTLMHVYLHVGVTLVRHYTVAMHTHTHTHTPIIIIIIICSTKLMCEYQYWWPAFVNQ